MHAGVGGLAEETDGAAQSPAATAGAPTGRAAGTTALESELLPAVRTKTTTAVPDKLYTLDIYQYTAAGVYLTYASLGDKEIGERFTTQLSDNGGNDCQLLVIARGSGGAVGSLQGKSLADVRKITANAALLQTIGVLDGTNIAQMPCLLYLPKVKISGGKIISPEAKGASAATTGSDVRLRLRRLAAGLTLDWKFSRSLIGAGYSLTEVRLMQIPANYYILPARERADLYGEMLSSQRQRIYRRPAPDRRGTCGGGRYFYPLDSRQCPRGTQRRDAARLSQ